uniref:Uncharacterized protein n=1 Tax=Leersia perrieri TaxID=77586 RepID=A0A0D9WS29_9ORYZ
MATAEVQQAVPAAGHDNNCEVHDTTSPKIGGAPLAVAEEKALHNNGDFNSKEEEIIKEKESITIDIIADEGNKGAHDNDITQEVEAKLAIKTSAATATTDVKEFGEEESRRGVKAKKAAEKAASKAAIVPVDDDEPDEEVAVVVAAPVANSEHQGKVEMVEEAVAASEKETTNGEQQALEDKKENACEKNKAHDE